jgi:general secretion pathway protein A
MIAVNAVGHQKPVESYERFFGLNEPPFSLAPNPRFVYESASHADALAQVAYSIERREPLVVITGEIGAGKTLLCRTVIHRIQRKTFLSVINDPQLERDDLLKQLLEDFGVISKDRRNLTQTSRHELFNTLQNFLVSLVPLQAHAVVVIDEAQHLKPDVLEQIRLLSNIDDARGTLLQIILVGQTDLEPLLSRPELRQFQQRVSRRFRLDPMRGDEIQQYIEHRLAVARGSTQSQLPGSNELEREVAAWGIAKPTITFTPDAIEIIGRLSGGLPRVINIVCDRALEIAHGLRSRTIDAKVIQTAASAVGLAAEPVQKAAAPQQTAAPQRQVNRQLKADAAEPATASASAARAPKQADKSVPVAFGALAQAVEQKPSRRWLMIAVPVAVVVVIAIWLAIRAANVPEPVRPAPRSAIPPAQTVPAPPAPTPPADTQPTPGATPGSAPSAPATPAAPAAIATPTAAPSATIGANGFDLVVASFRTEARADAVASQLIELKMSVRRRVSDGWQQVLSGPYASRADAEAARQRLDSVGLTGAQIVPR